MPANSEYCVAITTCASAEDAKLLAKALLDKRLAACIQVLPITSFYTWKGDQAEEAEVLLLIKARTDQYPQIELALKAVHKYEVPEIIQLPITAGFVPYLNWVNEVTT